jgi:arylsulfatase
VSPAIRYFEERTAIPRFFQVQVAKLAMTAIEFPPMQKGASFNLDAVKARIEAARAAMGK